MARNITTKDLKLFKKLQDRDIKQQIGKPLDSNIYIKFIYGDTTFAEPHLDRELSSPADLLAFLDEYNGKQIYTIINDKTDEVASTEIATLKNESQNNQINFNLFTTHGVIAVTVTQVYPEEGDQYLEYNVDWSRASFETTNRSVNSKYLSSISAKLGHNIYPINKIIENDNGKRKIYDPQELQEANFDSELYLRDDKFMTVIIPSNGWGNTGIEIRSLDEDTLCILDSETHYILTESIYDGNDCIILQLMINQGRKMIDPQEVIIYISHSEE